MEWRARHHAGLMTRGLRSCSADFLGILEVICCKGISLDSPVPGERGWTDESFMENEGSQPLTMSDGKTRVQSSSNATERLVKGRIRFAFQMNNRP